MKSPGIVTVDRGAEVIRCGGVCAFPTETVYGLGALALRGECVAEVFRVKGRPANNPLIVHVESIGRARALAEVWPERAEALARRFWPGPLTIVVRRSPAVPSIVTGGGETVAIRLPDHPIARELIRLVDAPIVGPSANRSGGVSPTAARHVIDSFGGTVPVIDGGECRTGIESTVVSVVGPTPLILRPGVVRAREVSEALGESVSSARSDATGDAPLQSPGLLRSHYAPRTPAVLLGRDDALKLLRGPRSQRVALLSLTITVGEAGGGIEVMPMPIDAREYARAIYAALRGADELLKQSTGDEGSLIIIERPRLGLVEEDDLWEVILDRLSRACAPRD